MWDKEYDTEEYIYGKSPNDFLKSHYDSIPKGKVLLLAEGEGRNAVVKRISADILQQSADNRLRFGLDAFEFLQHLHLGGGR